jgi:phosphoglycolate phosphatase-like HAD superfamily hydrolase
MGDPDPLSSWRPGLAKDALVGFVRSVTAPGDSFVPPSERIAAFDNDGTLWCEKPLYVQADFLFRRWREMAAADPELLQKQPYKAVVEGDREWLAGMLDHVPELLRGVAEACGGITTDAFEAQVRSFFGEARHPTLGVPYTQLGYRPMVELLRFLEANGFRSFICTGGGRDFVRVVAEEMYAIPREQVIGSATTLSLQDGALIRGADPEQPIDDGPGKPVHIWARTGRMPLLAGGNSDGDIEMLTSARFALLVHHDDAEREFAYDVGAERALATAAAAGWTVASMKSDFADVF